MKRIGIDIGGVLIEGSNEDGLFFSHRFLEVPEVQGAFEALAQLVTYYGDTSLFLVSKCSEPIQQKTLQWLEARQFYKRTGFLRHQVLFCRNRVDKSLIAQQQYLNTFVDDRFAVLQHMLSIQELYLFKPSENELSEAKADSDAAPIQVHTHWHDLVHVILKGLP